MDTRNMLVRIIPDAVYIQMVYYKHFRKFPDLKNPKTFNEKLQWLKLHDRKPVYTTMVDKYKVKDYVAGIIGENHIIPTLGVWDKPNEIEFDKLPQQFVLKWNHDSGSIIICKDKSNFDEKAAIEKLSGRERYNGYNYGREWPYKNVKPRIIAEQYMEDRKTGELRDYKFFCFNGKVKCFKIDFDRFTQHRANYYSPDGNLLYFGETICPPDFERQLTMPHSLNKMIKLAGILSNECPFMRVDFYEVNGRVYFGELTFFPSSGFGRFEPEEWDCTLGRWLALPLPTHEN